MNKIKFIALTASIALAITFTSCASKPPTQNQALAQQYSEPEQTSIVCFEYDTDEYITGFGEYRGSSAQLGNLVFQATERAKDNARQKLSARFQGITKKYSATWGNNQGNDLEDKVTSGGKEVIDRVLNDAKASCSSQDKTPGPDGHKSVYIGLRIYHKELASQFAATIDNKLTQEEKLGIDFREKKFFEDEWEKEFKNFKEENNPR